MEDEKQVCYSTTMKILHIMLIMLLPLVLASCKPLGIESTAAKERLKSEACNNQEPCMSLSDNRMHHLAIENDSIAANGYGLEDSLRLSHTDYKATEERNRKGPFSKVLDLWKVFGWYACKATYYLSIFFLASLIIGLLMQEVD